MRYCFIFIAFVSLLCACNENQPAIDSGVLIKVKDKTLNRSEIEQQIPRGISSQDSFMMAANLEKKWVKDMLVYEQAQWNLDREEQKKIDRLVDEYRNSLVRYRYQEQLLRERLSAEFQESDKLHYYEQNQKKFVLDKALVKGLFLKIPVDAPGLADVKKWYKSATEANLEKIEKYSIQNANIYDYFYDKWIDFDEVMDNIPLHVANPNDFLKVNKTIEMSDSSYCYLLNVSEYLPVGAIAPYDYAIPQISEMLMNQRKVDFLRKFEDELYNEAVRSGDVKLMMLLSCKNNKDVSDEKEFNSILSCLYFLRCYCAG